MREDLAVWAGADAKSQELARRDLRLNGRAAQDASDERGLQLVKLQCLDMWWGEWKEKKNGRRRRERQMDPGKEDYLAGDGRSPGTTRAHVNDSAQSQASEDVLPVARRRRQG